MKKEDIINFENKLEDEAGLISEAIHDVMLIVSLNDEKTAFELIKSQFVIINKQDLE